LLFFIVVRVLFFTVINGLRLADYLLSEYVTLCYVSLRFF